jgi:hypothetical protein
MRIKSFKVQEFKSSRLRSEKAGEPSNIEATGMKLSDGTNGTDGTGSRI